MADFLDKLRGKPPHVRQLISISISAVIVLAIFGFWLGSIDSIIEEDDKDTEKVEAVAPFKALGNNFAELVEGFKEGIDKKEKDDSVNVSSTTPEVASSTKDDKIPFEEGQENGRLNTYGGEGN